MVSITASIMAFAAFAIAAPTSGNGPEISLTVYGNGDDTCSDSNIIGETGVPTDGTVGQCIALPSNASTVQYRVAAYSSATNGCELVLFTNDDCTDPARGLYALHNGDLQCAPYAPAAGPWKSYSVTCPSS